MVKQISQAEFQKEVLESTMPVFVDFYAQWCGPCKITEPIIEELSESAEYKGKVAFVKIDVDENNDLAQQFNVFSIPTFMSFKGGQTVGSIVGARDKGGFKSEIDKLL